MKLSFYLFNDTVHEFDDVVKPDKTSGDKPEFAGVDLKESVPFVGKAYFQRNRPTPPKWLGFITPHCEVGDVSQILNVTNSFLLLIKVSNRIFAITTGFGFAAINRDKLEMNFGLRTSLNMIDPNRIKRVQARNIDLVTRQKITNVNLDSGLNEFELNSDDDLISSIAGQPKNTKIGKKVAGSDSLILTYEADFKRLGEKCKELLDIYQRDDYKEGFDFVDNIQQVRDKTLIKRLDQILRETLAVRSTEKLTLAQPTIDSEEQIESFRIRFLRESRDVEEVTVEEVYRFFEEEFEIPDSDDPIEINPHNVTIIGLDNNQNPVTKGDKLYDYIVFETQLNERTYILSLSKWYEVSADYIQRVQSEVSKIQLLEHTLPKMIEDEHEGEYNQRIASLFPDSVITLDRELIQITGHQTIEICDILTKDCNFVCVKKETRSSTLSHLFAQGRVSAILFNDDQSYREAVLRKTPPEWPMLFDVINPDKSKIKFVFAISSRKHTSLAGSLPFFSKVNLLQTKKDIERMGFKVELAKIEYQSNELEQ
ncbi:MAG: TIGR04141 family sporadically distributed protein [Anaerolineae bacterium]|nr:TIGR04141 family sporadically distributed protein [Anaerolineae bacterium]